VIAGGIAIRDHRPTLRDFGATSVPASTSAAPTSAAPTSAASTSAAASSSTAASTRPTAPIRAPAPAELTIPVLGVDAVVRPVTSSNGELGVPTDPAQVGWWTGSARVGAPHGTIVIDGHVDSAATGPGAFFRLGDLHAADRIVVATTTGQRLTYSVTGRRVYVKANGLPPDLFATDGPPRLVLITCGGPFDRTARSYLNNIVVFATPI